MTATNTPSRVLENRIRRVAARQGLLVEKSRRRDPLGYDFGLYRLVTHPTTPPCGFLQPKFDLTLAEVEHILSSGDAASIVRRLKAGTPDSDRLKKWIAEDARNATQEPGQERL